MHVFFMRTIFVFFAFAIRIILINTPSYIWYRPYFKSFFVNGNFPFRKKHIEQNREIIFNSVSSTSDIEFYNINLSLKKSIYIFMNSYPETL